MIDDYCENTERDLKNMLGKVMVEGSQSPKKATRRLRSKLTSKLSKLSSISSKC